MSIDYQEIMKNIILEGNGIIESDRFVIKPGVLVLNNHDGITPKAKILFENLGIDCTQNHWKILSEFNAKITYLAFGKNTGEKYHEKLIEQFGHLSPYSLPTPQILIAGCSIETSLEFIAHVEAKIARLTSSNTKAMNLPFFRIQGNTEQQKIQKEIINKQLEVINNYPNQKEILGEEFSNMIFPASKSTALCIGMNIKDWHKTISGRFSPTGVEKEVQEIIELIRLNLFEYYSPLIKSKDFYLKKYQ